MAGRNKLLTPDGRAQIAMLCDMLLGLGASWPDIRTELFRLMQTSDALYDEIPSQSTLEKIVCEHFDAVNLTELREKRKDSLKIQLKRKAVTMALGGNVSMLIFCLKNLAGWSDNVQPVPSTEEMKNTIRLAYDPKAL
jgi:hypothetical protein